jgi:hypothetical protein
MWNAFNREVKRHSFAIRIFAYILASYWLIIKRQNKELKTSKFDERARVAQLIEDGAPHKSASCGNSCDAHIIVQFIRELKD